MIRALKKDYYILSALFAILTLLGISYQKTNTWDLFFKPYNIFFFLVLFIIFLLFIKLLNFCFIKTAKNNSKSKILEFIFDSHPILFSFIFILLIWLPFLIIKYPGTPGWDFFHFLNNYYNFDDGLTHHFPIFYVFTCVSFIKFGIYIQNVNLGLFLLTIFHTLFMLISFSITFHYLKKWKINYKFRIFILLFFALNPLFCHYATTIYHDIIYSSLILIYILILTDIVQSNKIGKNIFILAPISLLICLSRKNGIFIIFPISIYLIFHFCKKNNLKKFILILPIIIYFCSNYLISLKYIRTSVLEALSIPLQTISRYSRDYHNDISISEKESINRIIDYDKIPSLYNPKIVDKVRNNFGNYNCNFSDVFSFSKVWIKLFFRHPDAYIQATLNNTYQLYYPFEKTTYLFFKVKDEESYPTIIDFVRPEQLEKKVMKLKALHANFQKIPILNIIDDPGIYSWILIYLIIKCIKNKISKKELLPLYPLIITFIICLLGPTIDYNSRYAFPIIFSVLPLWAFYAQYI